MWRMKLRDQLFGVVYTMDSLVVKFFDHFNQQYEAALATDFENMDLVNQMDYLKHIYKVILLHIIQQVNCVPL